MVNQVLLILRMKIDRGVQAGDQGEGLQVAVSPFFESLQKWQVVLPKVGAICSHERRACLADKWAQKGLRMRSASRF